MKVKQKSGNGAGTQKKEELPPTTTLMHRDTLKEGPAPDCKERGQEQPKDTKGAQDGKTPLGLWQPHADDILY
ncbi:MAG: hypothetical protein WC263_03765 [Candidatus Micrarchaeia archaeon]